MLTIQQAIDLGITHALHGSPAQELDTRWLMNQAGRHLTNMHGWCWRSRAARTVGVVAGQDYVLLPEDFGGLNSIRINGNVSASVKLVSRDEFMEQRSAALQPTQTTFWLCEDYDAPEPEDATMRMRFAIWPVPDSTNSEMFLLDYDGAWVDVPNDVDDSAYLPLPADSSCDMLFIQILRAMAKGLEEDDQRNLDAELAQIAQSETFRIAKSADAARQPQRGRIRGGALDEASRMVPPYRLYLDRLPEGYTAP